MPLPPVGYDAIFGGRGVVDEGGRRRRSECWRTGRGGVDTARVEETLGWLAAALTDGSWRPSSGLSNRHRS